MNTVFLSVCLLSFFLFSVLWETSPDASGLKALVGLRRPDPRLANPPVSMWMHRQANRLFLQQPAQGPWTLRAGCLRGWVGVLPRFPVARLELGGLLALGRKVGRKRSELNPASTSVWNRVPAPLCGVRPQR